MKTKKQTNYLDSRTKEEKKNEPIGSTCDDTVFIEGKKQTKNWEKGLRNLWFRGGGQSQHFFRNTKTLYPPTFSRATNGITTRSRKHNGGYFKRGYFEIS